LASLSGSGHLTLLGVKAERPASGWRPAGFRAFGSSAWKSVRGRSWFPLSLTFLSLVRVGPIGGAALRIVHGRKPSVFPLSIFLTLQAIALAIAVELHAPAREVAHSVPEIPESFPHDIFFREKPVELARIHGPRHGAKAVGSPSFSEFFLCPYLVTECRAICTRDFLEPGRRIALDGEANIGSVGQKEVERMISNCF